MSNNLGPIAVGIICEHTSYSSFILARDIIRCENAGLLNSAEHYRKEIVYNANKIIRLNGDLVK